MERLAVLRDDGVERHAFAHFERDALDCPRDVALTCTGTAHLHGRRVHTISDFAGILDFAYLLVRLLVAQRYDGNGKLYRNAVRYRLRADAEPAAQLQFVVGTVGRQEVHRTPFPYRERQLLLQHGQRGGMRNAASSTQFAYGRLRSRPDDVVHRQVVAEEPVLARINVEQADQVGQFETVEVEEIAVLTEMVAVVGIVPRSLAVAGQQNESPARYPFAQQLAPLDVGFFREHGDYLLNVILFSAIPRKVTIFSDNGQPSPPFRHPATRFSGTGTAFNRSPAAAARTRSSRNIRP